MTGCALCGTVHPTDVMSQAMNPNMVCINILKGFVKNRDDGMERQRKEIVALKQDLEVERESRREALRNAQDRDDYLRWYKHEVDRNVRASEAIVKLEKRVASRKRLAIEALGVTEPDFDQIEKFADQVEDLQFRNDNQAQMIENLASDVADLRRESVWLKNLIQNWLASTREVKGLPEDLVEDSIEATH